MYKLFIFLCVSASNIGICYCACPDGWIDMYEMGFPELGINLLYLTKYSSSVYRLSLVGEILFSRLDELGEG